MTSYSPLARRNDPQTSYVAAKQVDGSQHHESIRERILRALDDRGEIADYLGLRHEQVWRADRGVYMRRIVEFASRKETRR